MSRQTDYRHDDYKVQREFERLKKERVSAESETTPSIPDTTTTGSGTGGQRTTQPGLQYEVTSVDKTVGVKRIAGRDSVRYDISRPFSVFHEDEVIPDGLGDEKRVRVIDVHDTDTVMWSITGSAAGEIELRATRPLSFGLSSTGLFSTKTSTDIITEIWLSNETDSKPAVYNKRVYFDWEETPEGRILMEAWYEDQQSTYTWDLKIENVLVEAIDSGDDVDLRGINGVSISNVGRIVTFSRPFQVFDDGASVGGTDTTELEFDSNGQASTDVAVRFDVFDDASGRRRVRAFIPSTVAGYTAWNLEVDSVLREAINDSDDVDFVSGTGINLTGAARQIIINVDATPWRQTNEQNANEESYNVVPGDIIEFENATEAKPAGYTKRIWIDLAQVGSVVTIEGWYEDIDTDTIYSGWALEANGVLRENIDAGDDVDFIDGIATTVVGSGRQIQIDRPLQVKNAGVNVGDNATIALNADPQGQTSTDVAVNLQWVDDGSGQRTLRGWIPSAVAGYTGWNLEANGVLRELINDAEDVDFINGNGTTIGGTGRQIQVNVVDSTLKQINDENANEESYTYTPGHSLSFSNETEAKPVTYTQRVWFDLTSAAGAHVLEGFAESPSASSPLTIRQDGVDVGGNDTIVIDFDNPSPGKPAGYTKQAWVQVFDDGAGIRRAVIWYEDLTGLAAYKWVLRGPNDAGTDIDNTEIVTFRGLDGIIVERVSNEIHIKYTGEPSDGNDGGSGNSRRRILRGVIDLWTDDAPAPGYHGVKVFKDIVHDWNLGNMHGYHIRLETITFDETRAAGDPETLTYHWGDPIPTGLLGHLGNVPRRSFPRIYAVDENTIRVATRLPKLNGAQPTHLKYYYVLEEV